MVKVTEVDVARKRIGLSMKLGDAPGGAPGRGAGQGAGPRDNRFEPVRSGRSDARVTSGSSGATAPSAMASAFARLQGSGKDRKG